MSYKLMEQISEDTTIYQELTCVMTLGDKVYTDKDFKWKYHEGIPYITLKDIKGQLLDKFGLDSNNPIFIRVWYETGLWGVICEAGNYEHDNIWIVHGITKGYA